MKAFQPFELEAIRLLANGYMTGHKRRTLSEPAVVGNAGEVQAAFVAFLGDAEFVLECHTWGAVDIPSNFRELAVVISTPPVNTVDLRNGT